MTTRGKLAVSLTVVAMVLGFMITVQYRETVQSGAAILQVPAANTEEAGLAKQLSAIKQANNDAQTQLAELTQELTDYEQESAGSNSHMQQLQQRLVQERILAGLTPVQGPGIEVTLMDGTADGGNTEEVLTHDWDIRQVVNELFTAGAEAVDINDYRVVATSAVTCIGPVVKVNDHRLGAPFVIDAIGNPASLQSALDIQGGILDALRARGVSVAQPIIKQEITMPAFTGAILPTNSAFGG